MVQNMTFVQWGTSAMCIRRDGQCISSIAITTACGTKSHLKGDKNEIVEEFHNIMKLLSFYFLCVQI